MTNQRILIVDDEESILEVLRNSLRKMEAKYEVITATDGLTALEHLKENPFDLVVTDYKMAGMDGLELMEKVKSFCLDTRVILMTAYGSDAVEAEARRLQAYRYLVKPLQINTFRQVVEEALGNMAISRPGILILSDERYKQVVDQLKTLRDNVGARCSFLAGTDGHIVAKSGDTDGLPLEQIASLMGGGIATLIESGRVFSDDKESINLAYREGSKDCLYAINIGEQLVLILVIYNGPYTSRIGSVWYYAQRTAVEMRQTLGDADFASPQQIFDKTSERDLQRELDNLFPSEGVTDEAESEGIAAKEEPISEPAKSNEDTTVMAFDEAVKSGLVPRDLIQENGESPEID